MLGQDEIRELIVRIKPNGRAIQEILINGEPIDMKYLERVKKIGFEFEVEQDGFLEVSCTRTIKELAYSKTKMAAAALAGAKAAERDGQLRDEFCSGVDDV